MNSTPLKLTSVGVPLDVSQEATRRPMFRQILCDWMPAGIPADMRPSQKVVRIGLTIFMPQVCTDCCKLPRLVKLDGMDDFMTGVRADLRVIQAILGRSIRHFKTI